MTVSKSPHYKGPEPDWPNPMESEMTFFWLEDIRDWLLRKLSFGRIKR
jgi:hypothetical protein